MFSLALLFSQPLSDIFIIVKAVFFFKSMTYLEKDLFWYCTVLWLLSSGEYVNLREYKLQFEMSDAISWRLDRST